MMKKVRNLTATDLGVSQKPPRIMTEREEATVIAALRLWQNVQDGRLWLVVGPNNRVLREPEGTPVHLMNHFGDIATNLDKFAPLDIDGVDVLLDDVFGVA